MTGYEMFWPIIAHVALVYFLYVLLSYRRQKLVRGARSGDRTTGKIATSQRKALSSSIASPTSSNCRCFSTPVASFFT